MATRTVAAEMNRTAPLGRRVSKVRRMEPWSIVALAVGGAGLLGGILWGWAATRTAARLAFKIVGATADSGADSQLEARVTALEA